MTDRPVRRGRPSGPTDDSRASGALGEAMAAVGERWTLLVVSALLGGPRRFGDLLADLDGLAPNILSRRLQHLQREGLVVTVPYSHRPRRVVYQLSASGAELAGALRLLSQWGSGRADDDVPIRHLACGTPLEARWYCPTCARLAEGDGEDELYHL